MNSLTKEQQTTIIYITGIVLSLGLSGAMLYSLNTGAAALAKQKQEVELKESQARGARPAGVEEVNQWKADEERLTGFLLSEGDVRQLTEEVSRLATDTGMQRLAMNTEENVIDAAKAAASPEDSKIAAVGVHRYLTITMKFEGQYADVARFLGGVSRLRRPIEYRLIDMLRTSPNVEVQLLLNVYKRDAA